MIFHFNHTQSLQRFSSSSTPVMVRKPATRPRSVFKSEITLLARIKPHKNVLEFIGAVWEPATQMMQLFELCGNGNLRDFIRKVWCIGVILRD